MPERSSKKRPRDLAQLAKFIVDQATGEAEPEAEEPHPVELTAEERSRAAAALGRIGGLKGGKARAASLTPERRREIAKKAAEKRWGNPT
jgi:hypothetical protein